ncbi:MAG TPA: hypothetical protein VNT99_12155 [Methylomirabilota bacterium]|nr:hypothetical protein [Methylomirabilota bacterium]
MIAIRRRFSVLVLSTALFCSALHAQDLDLIGDVGWDQFGRGIQIRAERIENARTSGSSGFLRLQIWATTNVYDGVSDILGYTVGTFNLGRLQAGFSFVNAARVARFFKPPPGLYYTTMTLEEQTLDGFVIVDSVNFDGIVNFGGFGEGFYHFDLDNGDVGFVGDISWQAGNKRVQIFAEQILNAREFGRSGVLRVRLWATSTPYEGGTLQGLPMATKRVGRVNAGFYLSNFSRSTFFRPPPSDEYYVTMTLEELVRGRWEIVDYVTFPGTSIF